VDSIKFSGGIVASLSLMSSRILRLRIHDEEADAFSSAVRERDSDYSRSESSTEIDTAVSDRLDDNVKPGCFYEYEYVCLPRSLYILTDQFRYHYTHEVLGMGTKEKSSILVDPGSYQRRLSVMFRDDI
jgi:hypothetical protein